MSVNQSLGENSLDRSFNERYVFLYDLPSLQKMASYEVCRTIWYSNLSKYQLIEAEDTNVIHCRFMIGFYLFEHYQKHIKQLIKHLNVPALIEGILENSMKKVCAEIGNWVMEFYYRIINLEGHCGINVIDPKWLVWSVKGEIDFSKSARRVVQDVSLTEWQKFLVMCKYCMADEISKFSLDSLPPQFFTENFRVRNIICFYWICYLRNELHRIPVRNNESADWTISRNHADFQLVKIFFWDRLNDDQRVTLVAYWINQSKHKSTKDLTILEQIISRMSLSQQQRVLRETRRTIVSYFALYSGSSRCALWAWRCTGDQMDVEHFAKLVEELLKTNITWKSTSLLSEIWNTASAHQRNHVIRKKLNKFVDLLLTGSGSSFSDRFLQFISDDKRKKLIFRLVNSRIFYECDPDFSSRFLSLHLPHPDDQLTFRKLVIDSPVFVERLLNLLECKEYERFDETVNIYFSHDAAAAQIFKREFLEEKLKGMELTFNIELTSIDEWNRLSRFIDEVFDEDSKRGLMVKQWFIKSGFTQFTRCICILISSTPTTVQLVQGFDDFVKIVEMVFKDDELKNVKRLFSDQLCSISTGPAREAFFVAHSPDNVSKLFPKFMQWCSLHDGKPILKL
ncbi:uncharacterized protein LOC135844978 [Planococcus citri]|uniref:uncharacterized protein LOC135844978 n=1 Tax=Planococcus citri TaxID=170843 RepID=UPI0031F72AC3